MSTSIEEQLRAYSEWSDAESTPVTAAEAARVTAHFDTPGASGSRPVDRRFAVAAASLVLVLAGIAGIAEIATRDRGNGEGVTDRPSTAPTNPVVIGATTETEPLVATALPADLIYRGSTTVPAVARDVAPMVFMSSADATITFDIGDPTFAADIERPTDVEDAIRTPRATDPGFIALDWTNLDDDILVVVADGAPLDVVAPLARRFDQLRKSGQSLDLIAPPEGFEVFDVQSLPPTVEYRWTSADEARGLLVRTESNLPLAPQTPLRSSSFRLDRSATTSTVVSWFGLEASEVDPIRAGLRPVAQADLPTPVPSRPHPIATNPDPETFATDRSEDHVWTIEGRLAGKDTPVSGIVEVRDEQRGDHLNPFDQLLDPIIYPVGEHGVLVAYTADAVRSVHLEWLDSSGAVVVDERTGEHLATMLNAGYPPLIAATSPAGAVTLRLTPEAANNKPISDPINVTDLTPINPPG